MKLGEKIQMLRTEKRISATAFAEMLNRKESAVRMWESGNSKPDIETLIEISKVFGCSTDFLLSLSPHRNEAAKESLNDAVGNLCDNLAKLDNKRPAELIQELNSCIHSMILWKIEPPTEHGLTDVISMLKKTADVIRAYIECLNVLDEFEYKEFPLRLKREKLNDDESHYVMTNDEVELSGEYLATFKTKLLEYSVSKENCLNKLHTLLNAFDLSLFEKSSVWNECEDYFNERVTRR